MSESEKRAPDTGEGELTTALGPGDPGQTSASKISKDSRRVSSSSERQIKVERAQKCLENAALVSKRIKEHRRATAELLGKSFDDEGLDAASDLGSVSTHTGYTSYSAATSDAGPPISVEDALNIPGISESLANTLKQKELLMERIKQYKEISKRERPSSVKSKKSSSLITSSVQEENVATKDGSKHDITQLECTLKEKQNTISIMQVKMKAMETTILDLQEKISEKDSVIEAKNRATSLMSDNLSKKEKDSVSLLEDTRQQMVKMQENFVAMETEWKLEKDRLLNELQTKNEKIKSLEEANAILEDARFEASLTNSKLIEEINEKNKFISDLEEKLSKISKETTQQKEHFEEEKGSQEISNMVEMTKRLELLEHLNCQIKQTNLELENKLASLSPQGNIVEPTASKKLSPQVTRKRGKSATRNTSAKVKSPWTALEESSQDTNIKTQSKDTTKDDSGKSNMVIQSLNKELLEKEFLLSQKDSLLKSQQEIIAQKEEQLKAYESSKPIMLDVGLMCETGHTALEKETLLVEDIEEKTPEELLKQLNDAQSQVSALNIELESANKNMIKVKSAHKLKLKQMQKTIDNFTKMSDSNAEVSRLSEEVNNLTQKIAELEEDKGNLQLHLVDYDSGRLTESELSHRLITLESLSEARLKSIADLESQKFDLVQELHILQQKNSEIEDKLTDLQHLYSDNISTEMRSAQLEEQLDKAAASRKELELITENLKLDKEHFKQCIKELQDKNIELSSKLDVYIQENIDLTDRLEKLSAEKVSSAESIEMVEALTAQEKIELEEYNKKIKSPNEQTKAEDTVSSNLEKETNEFSENLIKLSQESEELHKKIELFTQERHEVMEKMTQIKSENEQLHLQLQEVNNIKKEIELQVETMRSEKENLEKINRELVIQIENLKTEHLEILRENANTIKRPVSEEASTESESPPKESPDSLQGDSVSIDEKPQLSKAKNPKQMTKEILKLKNVIKEREAEIADCQMKILSLEEQQQKQSDIIASSERSMKTLIDENSALKEESATLKSKVEKHKLSALNFTELESLQQTNEELQNVIKKTTSEYLALISSKEERINELERLLIDYENNIAMYMDMLQEKDKDLTDYLNQISQLNNVSQKLKSTIELLEEEKLKDPNGELIKNLNHQINNFKTMINEQEIKIKMLEDDKHNLLSIKSTLEKNITSCEDEIKKLYNSLLEKDMLAKDLQDFKNNHEKELTKLITECKCKDEEIHEIKLQLRKESIENENLRQSNDEFNLSNSKLTADIEALHKLSVNFEDITRKNEELNNNVTTLETKNKELMDKLKKFAANLKKKTNICAELDNENTLLKVEIGKKQDIIDSLDSRIISLTEEIEQLKSQACLASNLSLDQNKMQELEIQVLTLLQEKSGLAEQLKDLEQSYLDAEKDKKSLSTHIELQSNQLQIQEKDITLLKSKVDELQKELQDRNADHTNNINLNNKVSELELNVKQKQDQVVSLLFEIEKIQDEFNTFKFGQEAKIHEKDLFIESLETEISKYRTRISRLEESISIMEDRRHSLERKADQLGNQLEEKQKAYRQYSTNEDELVNRLAVLMEHDQVVEKQLKEIEKENWDLQNKIQNLIDDNKHLLDNLLTSQEECVTIKENSNKVHQEELDICNARISQLEVQIKNMSIEHQGLLKRRQDEIHALESEFNVQIENSIKERKSITEKYEKEKENNEHMEMEIQQHVEQIKTLSSNLEELANINSDLHKKANDSNTINNDYTEQYISEINNMQAIIRRNNSQIDALEKYQSECKSTITALEVQLNDSKEIIKNKSLEIESLRFQLKESHLEIENLKINNSALDSSKTSSFASENVFYTKSPGVEEKLVQPFDLTLLESQIEIIDDKNVTQTQEVNQMCQAVDRDGSKDDIIVPKKAYLCYSESTNIVHDEKSSNIATDPFNSEEGWGFAEKSVEYEEENYNSNILTKINQLTIENEQLKTDICNMNKKLAKALKKLKEFKAQNEKLANELKNNQILQLSTLDNTIEDELKFQKESLEKTIESISADLAKEKREKDSLCKQNEIFKNANDRFLEMKEKLENEVVMWKYKFKELTDKVSSDDWEDNKKTHHIKPDSIKFPSSDRDINAKDMIEQIERENDDLNLQVEQLKKENSEQSIIQTKQKAEIHTLQNELSVIKSNFEKCQEEFIIKQNELQSVIDNLHLSSQENETTNSVILEKLAYESNNLKDENVLLKSTIKELTVHIDKLTEECHISKENNILMNAQLSSLKNENLQNNADILQNELILAVQKCKSLEDEMQKLNIQLENSLSDCEKSNSQLMQSNEKVALLEKKASECENKFIKLNEENDQLLSTVTELRTSITSAVDQRGYEVAEMWKQHLAQRESEFATAERELRDQIIALETKYENLLDNVQSSSQEETNKMIVVEQLLSMQAKLKDKEDHLTSLQNQYSNLVSEMQMLRAEIEDEKVMCENKLLNQQEEYEKQFNEIRDLHVNDNTSKDYRITELNKQLEKAKEENQKIVVEMNEMSKVIEVLKNNLSELNEQLIYKDNEISQKTKEFTFVLDERNKEFETLKQKLTEYEKKIEESSFEMESELAVMRLKMHEQLTDFEKHQSKLQCENDDLVKSLTDKIQECTTLNRQITDLNKSLQDDSLKINEMQSALESQELEIVTLKDDIERLQFLLDSSTAKISKHVTFASDTKPATAIEGDEDKGASEPADLVSRTELDLALYMLYQRDMRCEELTMELSSLLEERDTLQLRLSNALRTYEDLRRKQEVSDADVAAEVKEIIETNQTIDTFTPSTSQEGASNIDTLKTKLTELRSVRQSRDVRLRQDSERRDMDMQLLHRDVSRLPPEAADQLRQAHYTLSRDSQSASSVLLNWLMGKSTPKVVHM